MPFPLLIIRASAPRGPAGTVWSTSPFLSGLMRRSSPGTLWEARESQGASPGSDCRAGELNRFWAGESGRTGTKELSPRRPRARSQRISGLGETLGVAKTHLSHWGPSWEA